MEAKLVQSLSRQSVAVLTEFLTARRSYWKSLANCFQLKLIVSVFIPCYLANSVQ